MSTDDEPLKVNPTRRSRLKVRAKSTSSLKVKPDPKPLLKIRKPEKRSNGKPKIGHQSSYTCPYCLVEIAEGEAYYECPICTAKHHQDCWEEAAQCGRLASHV